jgi:hypothetical protein
MDNPKNWYEDLIGGTVLCIESDPYARFARLYVRRADGKLSLLVCNRGFGILFCNEIREPVEPMPPVPPDWICGSL